MEKIKLFYQPRCPFCKRAFAFIDELIAENPEFAKIEIERIDELEQPAYADQFDYYYVPTFYVGDRTTPATSTTGTGAKNLHHRKSKLPKETTSPFFATSRLHFPPSLLQCSP